VPPIIIAYAPRLSEARAPLTAPPDGVRPYVASLQEELTTVAKITPTSAAVRRRYRNDLTQEGHKRAFDDLAKLIDAPQDTLAWHHQMGRLVGQLRPENPRGTQWSRKLAQALGPSPELLEKSLRFAKEYPTKKELGILEGMGVNWTRLYFSFVVEDRAQRHALLQEALREHWSDKTLRLTIQERYPSNRRGVGGRKRKAVTGHGPEVALREMERQCRTWKESHAGSWAVMLEEQWERLVQEWPVEEKEKLRELLKAAAASVETVAQGCEEVRSKLSQVLGQMGQS
jgi:hypothetical protein